MKTKLHGLLTELLEAWDMYHLHQYEHNWEDVCDAVGAIRDHLKPVVRTEEEIWAEFLEENKVLEDLVKEIGEESFEGHPPGNPFEGDDK